MFQEDNSQSFDPNDMIIAYFEAQGLPQLDEFVEESKQGRLLLSPQFPKERLEHLIANMPPLVLPEDADKLGVHRTRGALTTQFCDAFIAQMTPAERLREVIVTVQEPLGLKEIFNYASIPNDLTPEDERDIDAVLAEFGMNRQSEASPSGLVRTFIGDRIIGEKGLSDFLAAYKIEL